MGEKSELVLGTPKNMQKFSFAFFIISKKQSNILTRSKYVYTLQSGKANSQNLKVYLPHVEITPMRKTEDERRQQKVNLVKN